MRKQYLGHARQQAPSTAGQPKDFAQQQMDHRTAILCGRPRGVAGTIPVTLLHPIFGAFLDDIQTHQPTEEDNALALHLSETMANFHPNETERATAIRDVLMTKGGITLMTTTIEGTKYTTDGDLQHNRHRYLIAELKNEVSSGKTEPTAQAAMYYLESTRALAPDNPKSSLPCLLLYIFGRELSNDTSRGVHCFMASGPYLGFGGAVWIYRPHVQVLSTVLPFHFHHTDVLMQKTIACHLGALKKAIRSLEQYYTTELPAMIDPGSTSPPQVAFPYRTSYMPIGSTALQSFTYASQLHDNKLLFFGNLPNNSRICIKFTQQYSVMVHKFCALNGFAPSLHGFENIPGGWYMVVMEAIDDNYEEITAKHRSAIHQIKANLVKLHQAGYVHGDIRNTNVMVRKDGSNGIMLIDFDWAGEIGHARYPADVNRKDIMRPDGARDGATILADHDMYMLDHLIVE